MSPVADLVAVKGDAGPRCQFVDSRLSTNDNTRCIVLLGLSSPRRCGESPILSPPTRRGQATSTPPVTGELCKNPSARKVVSTILCRGRMNSTNSEKPTTSAVAILEAMKSL